MLLLPVLSMMVACGGLTGRVDRPSVPVSPGEIEARRLLATFTQNNPELKSFKGTGKLRFKHQGQAHTVKILWIGAEPHRLRMMLQDLSGVPLVSLADDGDWFYVRAHTEKNYFKKKRSGVNLKRYLTVPVRTAEIHALLSGRIPAIAYRKLKWETTDPWTPVLVLKTGYGKTIQRIHFNADKTQILRVEQYDGSGAMSFRLVFDAYQRIDEFQVPANVRIVKSSGDTVFLKIDRYWTNPTVKPTVFTLAPPTKG